MINGSETYRFATCSWRTSFLLPFISVVPGRDENRDEETRELTRSSIRNENSISFRPPPPPPPRLCPPLERTRDEVCARKAESAFTLRLTFSSSRRDKQTGRDCFLGRKRKKARGRRARRVEVAELNERTLTRDSGTANALSSTPVLFRLMKSAISQSTLIKSAISRSL